MVITPPQIQFNVQVLFKAGILASITVALPGTQGAGVTGMQGMGVSTPKAAVVAAATVGFASDVHIAKGRIFTMGLLSMILAAGILLVITLLAGNTTKDEGAAPNEQAIIAPIHTCCGIIKWFY
jgi:hypothetical protein